MASAESDRTDPCTRFVQGSDRLAGPCPVCDHTTLVHPGNHNPGVRECPMCALEIAVASVKRAFSGE